LTTLPCAHFSLQVITLWGYAAVFGQALAGLVGLPGINGGESCDVYDSGGMNNSGCVALYVWSVARELWPRIPCVPRLDARTLKQSRTDRRKK